ncbi:hypothetical protein KQI65_13645 [bacterium]|nr:hypothetical protein [bacterium]
MPDTQPFFIATIDEDAATVRLLQRTLGSGEGYQLRAYPTAARFVEHMQEDGSACPSAILLALTGEGIAPLSDVSRVQKCCASVPLIILTDTQHRETAYEALRRGAADYFSRPIDVRRLSHVLPRMIARSSLASSRESTKTMTMDEVKQAAVRQALRSSRGNVREAARLLGIGRTTMYTLMDRYGIEADRTLNPRV